MGFLAGGCDNRISTAHGIGRAVAERLADEDAIVRVSNIDRRQRAPTHCGSARQEHSIVIGKGVADKLFGLIDRLDPTTPVTEVTALLKVRSS